MLLFIQKLKEILDNSKECKGTYELVPISGNDPHEVSDVLIRMQEERYKIMESNDQNKDNSKLNNANSV